MNVAELHAGPASAGAPEADAKFAAMVRRLSRQSVDKHFDAYKDVAWDDPDYHVDWSDPRWELPSIDALGHTFWYRSQPQALRSKLALHRIAACMRVGWEFENVLQRGLLAFAMKLPNGAPEFRYLHHEVVEESQHTMMFQEFINRTGLPVRGMRSIERIAAERFVIPMGRIDPAIFFLFVLGGEDPVDHLQRQQLRDGVSHPLLERIMRIHVTEEARHISFARNYLKSVVPNLSRTRKAALAVQAPVLYGAMTRMMCDPHWQLAKEYGIPTSVMQEAKRSQTHRRLIAECGSKPRKLCADLGLIDARMAKAWDRLGLTITAGTDAATAPL